MQDLTPFVEGLIAAHRSGRRFRPDGACPATTEDAYHVHAALMEAFGPVGGFKVSQKPNQPPVVAPIPESRCRPSGTTLEVPRDAAVELEVGFVVVDTLPAPDAPDLRRRLVSAVRPTPMIEVVASRIEGPLGETAAVKLADLQSCEALIFGEVLADWSGTDLGHPAARLTRDGHLVFDATGAVPAGTALDALETTLRVLGQRFGGLQPGHKILTGALFAPVSAPDGGHFAGAVEGLGPVAVDLRVGAS